MGSSSVNPNAQKLEAAFDAILERTRKSGNAGPISLAFQAPSISYTTELADRPPQKFFTASVTKMFTAVALQQLEQSKILALDQKLSEYLTESELSGLLGTDKEKTAGDLPLSALLANRSGIGDYYIKKRLDPKKDIESTTRDDPGWSFREAMELAKQVPAKTKRVRTQAHYSFTNFQILSEVIERASSEKLSEVFEKNIISPLGLQDTFLYDFDCLIRRNEVAQMKFGTKNYLGFNRMASLRGEGALVSTAPDLIVFLRYLESNLGGTSIREQLTMGTAPLYPFISYGLGIMRVKIPGPLIGSRRAPVLFGHFGASGSFAFFEQSTNSYIAGTVNQIGDPKVGSKLLFGLISKAMNLLTP